MTVLKTIIVDDERLARRGLALRLQDIPQVEVVAECANGEQALQAIAQHGPDLVFLDIQMPGMDGFDVVCELQSDSMPMIIFVTAFDQYAVEAFKVHAVDYVLKPIEDERLREAVSRAISRQKQQDSIRTKEQLMELMQSIEGPGAVKHIVDDTEQRQRATERLTIKDGSEYQFIKLADIQWVDAAGDYMCVHAAGKTHIMRTTMKQLEATLDPKVFLRIHRSSIVNINCIGGAQTFPNGEYLLTLEGGAQLKVSRSYGHKIKSLLDR
jgi:two-component system LytT family response regulator